MKKFNFLVALGGKAYRAPKIEVGFPEITLTTEGKSDPVLSSFKVKCERN